MGPGRSVYIVPYGVVACARLSDSIVPTYQNEQSENKTHAFLFTERLFITISEPGTGYWGRIRP